MPRASVLYPEFLGSICACICFSRHSQSFVHWQLSSSIVFDALSPSVPHTSAVANSPSPGASPEVTAFPVKFLSSWCLTDVLALQCECISHYICEGHGTS